jgi:hypothetical protein
MNVLDAWPSVRGFVAMMSHFFPIVTQYQQTSSMPQVTALASAIACLFAPIQFAFAMIAAYSSRISLFKLRKILRLSMLPRIVLLFGMPLAIGIAYWGAFSNSADPEICKGCSNDSRIVLSLIVGVGPAALALLSHAYVVIAKYAAVILSSPRKNLCAKLAVSVQPSCGSRQERCTA